MIAPAAAQGLQALIETELGSTLAGVQVLDRCDSTNRLCMQMGAHRQVVIAREQSAGRGRRGNRWYSPAGRNLYCSIGLEKKLAGEYLGLLPLQLGVAIVEVLHAYGATEVRLKWPNDIIARNCKLGGLLIESRPLAEHAFFFVIGLGLNIELDAAALAAIEQPAISLNQLMAHLPDQTPLTASIIANMIRAVDAFDATGIDDLLQRFEQLDAYHQQVVTIVTREGVSSGRYLGVHRSGQLRLLTDKGEQLFSAAEISLRPLQRGGDATD